VKTRIAYNRLLRDDHGQRAMVREHEPGAKRHHDAQEAGDAVEQTVRLRRDRPLGEGRSGPALLGPGGRVPRRPTRLRVDVTLKNEKTKKKEEVFKMGEKVGKKE